MEDFTNYSLPSMFIITSTCNWKCCHDGNFSESVCQNNDLIKNTEIKEYKIESIYNAYISNPITKSIVIGGLEPFLQFDEVASLIKYFRDNKCNDNFIIYTGYREDEIQGLIDILKLNSNIIVKFGRYVPNQKPHRDEVLGIDLASDNQYAEKVS